MYEIIDIIRDYLFVTLRLRNTQTGVTKDWGCWDDLEDDLRKEYNVDNLKGLVLDGLPKRGCWEKGHETI